MEKSIKILKVDDKLVTLMVTIGRENGKTEIAFTIEEGETITITDIIESA
jgi:hypothetical protein